MQSMLKKTLIAAAVASLASTAGAATVGTVDTDAGTTGVQPQKVSSEGLETLGYVMIGDSAGVNDLTVTVTTGADYQETDLLVVTITGATIANTVASSVTLVDQDADTIDTDGADTDTIPSEENVAAIGVDAAAGTITFRPTSGTEFESGVTFDLRGVKLTNVTGPVSVSTAGKTVQNIAFDAGSAQTIATVGSQFAVKVSSTVLDRVIDVENERKQFVAIGADVKNDSVVYDLTNSAHVLAANVVTSSVALKGSDLSFLNDKDGKLAAASYELLGATEDTSAANKAVLSADGTTLTVKSTNAPGATIGMELTVDGKADANAQVLTAQSFAADIGLNYNYMHDGSGTHGTTTGSVMFSNQAAGSWTLSGAQFNVPYMPYGSGITQVIYISNDGKVNGDIELTAFDDEGKAYGPVKLDVTAAPGTVTQLSSPIHAALAAEGFDFSGKADLTIVVNSPKAQVDVYAAYNARGDRATVTVNKQ